MSLTRPPLKPSSRSSPAVSAPSAADPLHPAAPLRLSDRHSDATARVSGAAKAVKGAVDVAAAVEVVGGQIKGGRGGPDSRGRRSTCVSNIFF